MAQITLRVPGELARALKEAAAASGRSLNSWATSILAAVVDPDFADGEAERLRERLRRAGVLTEPSARVSRPKRTEVTRARRSAGRGTALSELVSEGRR